MELVGHFKKYKDALVEHFGKSSVCGELLTEANEENMKELLETVMNGLTMVTDEESVKSRRMRVRNFLQRASKVDAQLH